MSEDVKSVAKWATIIFFVTPLFALVLLMIKAFIFGALDWEMNADKAWGEAWNYAGGFFIGWFFAKQK